MKRLAALAILVLGSAHVAHAQFTTTLLYIPVNARSVGMGYGGIADNAAPNTIYFNPANVIAMPRAYISATNQTFDNDLFDDDVWARRADAGAAWKVGASSAWTLGADLAYARLSA